MRTFTLYALPLVLICALRAETPTPTTSEAPLIPALSWSDIQALYAPNRKPGDWDSPKVKSIPREAELISQCQKDLARTLRLNPASLDVGPYVPPGTISFQSLHKDPVNRIIYFVLRYDSDLPGFFVVYYYDPVQNRFILKSRRM
jgi:hypothetical protein